MNTPLTAHVTATPIDADQSQAICEQALKIYGADAQINMCMEEFSEAIAALNRYRRGRTSSAAAAEEIADATIMLEQMALLFGPDLVRAARQRKLHRLHERLSKDRAHRRTAKGR